VDCAERVSGNVAKKMKKRAIKQNVQLAPREKPMMEKYFDRDCVSTLIHLVQTAIRNAAQKLRQNVTLGSGE
jgi:hypothetical protein